MYSASPDCGVLLTLRMMSLPTMPGRHRNALPKAVAKNQHFGPAVSSSGRRSAKDRCHTEEWKDVRVPRSLTLSGSPCR